MTGRALVIGEALIDVVERDGRVLGEYVGGSPLNVAVGLARLGRPADFLTHIGDDDRGRRISEYIKQSGAQLVSGSRTARRTPTARAVLDADGVAEYEFDIDWRLSGTAEVAPPVVAHTGSIAAVLEPGCRAAAALLDAYHVAATITFDPNVRPASIADENAARSRIDRLVQRCDVVKASEDDLRWIDPERSPERTARTIAGLGPSIVAVTMGERGAFAMCAAGRVDVPALAVDVVDTVGAGDAFTVGMIDALWSMDLLGANRRRELARISVDALRQVVEAATLSAAVVVTRAGADLADRATLDAARTSFTEGA